MRNARLRKRPRRARRPREIPLVYEDGFRGLFTFTLIPVAILVVALLILGGDVETAALLTLLCAVAVASSVAYLVWTHILFARAPHAVVSRIAARQHGRRPTVVARVLGMDQQDAGSMSLTSAALTIAVAVASIVVVGQTRGGWLPLLVLATAATSWATMAYSFALRYYRLHCGGEGIDFDIDEEPGSMTSCRCR